MFVSKNQSNGTEDISMLAYLSPLRGPLTICILQPQPRQFFIWAHVGAQSHYGRVRDENMKKREYGFPLPCPNLRNSEIKLPYSPQNPLCFTRSSFTGDDEVSFISCKISKPLKLIDFQFNFNFFLFMCG